VPFAPLPWVSRIVSASMLISSRSILTSSEKFLKKHLTTDMNPFNTAKNQSGAK
jgi:hypothetical protein